MPNTTDPESTSSLEYRDQENQAQSTAIILNMDKEEFQKLQENDSTLEPIRKLVRESTTTGNTGKFFQRKGLIYRQWRPKDNHEDDSGSIEQLVIPRKCRKVALELAHDVPIGGHLGSKKTLDRLLSRFYWPGIIHDVGQHCKGFY